MKKGRERENLLAIVFSFFFSFQKRPFGIGDHARAKSSPEMCVCFKHPHLFSLSLSSIYLLLCANPTELLHYVPEDLVFFFPLLNLVFNIRAVSLGFDLDVFFLSEGHTPLFYSFIFPPVKPLDL